MKLNFVFLAFLLMSAALAEQDYSRQAACLRDTLGKLSQDGRIHAFGIRVTNESSIRVDSLQVGGDYSKLTSKLIGTPNNMAVDPTINQQNATVTATNRSISYADMQVLLQDPLKHVIDGSLSAHLMNETAAMLNHTKDQTVKQAANALNEEVIKLSTLEAQIKEHSSMVEELLKKMSVETNPAIKEELNQAVKEIDVTVQKLENKKATVQTDISQAKAEIKQLNSSSTIDMSPQAKEEITIINGQKMVKKLDAKKEQIQASVIVEKQNLQKLEDKLKLVTDQKEIDTIKKKIEKINLKVETLETKAAKVTAEQRIAEKKVEVSQQKITQIKQELKEAELKDMQKYGSACTSYSIRSSVKFCVKWASASAQFTPNQQQRRVCEQWKDIYRSSVCLQKDAAGSCIKKKYEFKADTPRYKCESHSTEFPKQHCMQWKVEGGKAVCSKTETFYQAKTCVEFAMINNEHKCIRYEGAYPAFKCVKTMQVGLEKVCKEMAAYTPNYYCKEFLMHQNHRYCKVRELFFGAETVKFDCAEKDQMKDETGQVHCLKFEIKKISQFANFHVVPITEKTITIHEKTKSTTEREVKKIDKVISKEQKKIEEAEKKITELKKTIPQVKTQTEVRIIEKIIKAEQKKAEALKHEVALQKEIKDKIKSTDVTISRTKLQIEGEIKDKWGRTVLDQEAIKKSALIIKEAKDKIKTETDPHKIEELKRQVSEEALKKREAKLNLITHKTEMQIKMMEMKSIKADVQKTNLEIKKEMTQDMLKKTTDQLHGIKDQIKTIQDAIKKTQDQKEVTKLVEKYKTLIEEAKTKKDQIKVITHDIKKIQTEEIVITKKTTKTELEHLKKEAEIIKEAIKKITTVITKITQTTTTTTTKKETLDKLIKDLKEKEKKALDRIDDIKKKSEVKIDEIELEKPPVIETTTKPVEPSTCIKTTVIDIPIDMNYNTEQSSASISGDGSADLANGDIQVEIHSKATCLDTKTMDKVVTAENKQAKVTEEATQQIVKSTSTPSTDETTKTTEKTETEVKPTTCTKESSYEVSVEDKVTDPDNIQVEVDTHAQRMTSDQETSNPPKVQHSSSTTVQSQLNSDGQTTTSTTETHTTHTTTTTTTTTTGPDGTTTETHTTHSSSTTQDHPTTSTQTQPSQTTTSTTSIPLKSTTPTPVDSPVQIKFEDANSSTPTPDSPVEGQTSSQITSPTTESPEKPTTCTSTMSIDVPVDADINVDASNASFEIHPGTSTELGLTGIHAEVIDHQSFVHEHSHKSPRVRGSTSSVTVRSSQGGRRLQSTTTNNADMAMVQTFMAHMATFKPTDRALLSKCLV